MLDFCGRSVVTLRVSHNSMGNYIYIIYIYIIYIYNIIYIYRLYSKISKQMLTSPEKGVTYGFPQQRC